MHVSRIGLTPVKGGRHLAQESVLLTASGPSGDRVFCLVDPAENRCVRTVENPALLQTCASWDGRRLHVDLPSRTAVGEPVRTGQQLGVDYWGRVVDVEVVHGPWAAAYSAHLGREVVVAACGPGEVVYGASVTLVTGSSLAWLAEEVGAPVEGARFRATIELQDEDLPARAEEAWVGRSLRIGTAAVRVRGLLPRCAVIDVHPVSGVRDLALMTALGKRRSAQGEVVFGVDAEVVRPGMVSTGDLSAISPT